MAKGTIEYSSLYNVSKLFADYLDHKLTEFYEYDYSDENSLHQVVANVDKSSKGF